MTQQAQTDLQPDSKSKKAEEPAVELDSSYEQPVWQAAPIAQHAPREITPRQMLQLQRTVGNTAARGMVQRNTSNRAAHKATNTPPAISIAPSNAIQRASATVNGKLLGKTNILDPRKRVVANVAKNVVLEVDTERNISGVQCYRVIDADEDMFTNVTSAFDPNDIYIAKADVTVAPPRQEPLDLASLDDIAPIDDEAESDPAALEIELFEGHKFVLTPDGGKLEGEHEQSLEADLPSVDLSIDIPIPAAPGVYVSAGLAITPSLGLAAKLAYALEKNATETKFNIEAELGGSTGLEITAKALVGVGLANVAGLSAGLFAEAKASAELKGKLAGEVVKKTDKSWKSSSLKLSLEAEASIVGAVGAMLQAKLGPFSAAKKYKIKEKEFAKFEWKREGLNIEKQGVTLASVMPKLSDFKIAPKTEPALDEVISDTAPLLGRGQHSDDYD